MDLADRGDVTRLLSPARTERPAVGVSASHLEPDVIARVVLRATRRGHAVLLSYVDDSDVEGLDFLDSFDVVVRIESTRGATSPIETLTEAARAHGFPGLIFHDTNGRIDYDRTASTWGDDAFVTRAQVEEDAPRGRPTTVVAIPAYNEEGTIGEVVERAAGFVDRVLVVDDGSRDRTAARAEAAGAEVVTHEANAGYGASLKTAFRVGRNQNVDRLVVLDADGQHDPADVPRLLSELDRDDVDVVIGSRNVVDSRTSMPVYRRVGFGVVNVLTNLSLGVVRPESWVNDTQSGFRAYDRPAIETLAADEMIGDHMNASTDILYHAHHHGHRIEEVGIDIDYDVENGSSHHPLVHGIVLVSNILRTIERKRPLTLIGIPGFAVTLLGIFSGYWSVVQFTQTGVVPFAPALLAMLLVLVGMLACFTSLVLHSINTHLYPLERRRRGARGE